MNKLMKFLPWGKQNEEAPIEDGPTPFTESASESRARTIYPEVPNGEASPGELTPPELRAKPFEKFPPEFTNRQVQKQMPFVWETSKGEMICPRDMATPHLFNAFRMLFNHSVPPAFRVGTFKRRSEVNQWPAGYRIQASIAIETELAEREDIESWMRNELQDICDNTKFLVKFARMDFCSTRESIQVMLDGAPPFDPQKLARFTSTKNGANDFPISAGLRQRRVRGYTRANGNKVKGYWR